MPAPMTTTIARLVSGTPVPFGGDRLTVITPELAEAFQPGDHLLVLQETGDLLHIPAAQIALAASAVDRAHAAFMAMSAIPDRAVERFFDRFAALLEDPSAWRAIAEANRQDVERAQGSGRSTTRLVATDRMRQDMIAGLRAWRDSETLRGRVVERIVHTGWTVEQVAAPLGVVGFVFEGRPNVLADAAGVLRSGNTAVFRIGSDALGTAQAIMRHALVPALDEAGLPPGAISLVESPERSTGWALFADRRLSLAVARGSGRAVAQLGSVARQAGTAVSLHGTGGAWMVADRDADAGRFSATVEASLDRKVCNTLNVCCIHRARVTDLVPAFLAALEAAGRARGFGCKLHVVVGDETVLPEAWRTATVRVRRAESERTEPLTEIQSEGDLGHEWEWEDTPEVSLKIVDDLDHAVTLFNRHSPRFAASLISRDPEAHRRFYDTVNAPFVGDGFTRWVDGQYALNQPELGLSNWQSGRLLARSAILSGSGVFTVRSRVTQDDPRLRR
ncbi:gamma-glutamyl phosphate reductase [Methylobacterium phyllosphaerae]|uniref:Gamma-glutamyl phosphate reductase n=2 Tax=Methylobacterium phyllosphaerae TaxID=418223 RepID=A0AAE8HVB5_9HYPH|nr:gamma-glutamyl phosphate reductase [Methylobacterium phyllosphaerae]SFH36216.1 glutamate-5-semialdehyde dehydrogenase [Methylobacterium phyllosphaerae]